MMQPASSSSSSLCATTSGSMSSCCSGFVFSGILSSLMDGDGYAGWDRRYEPPVWERLAASSVPVPWPGSSWAGTNRPLHAGRRRDRPATEQTYSLAAMAVGATARCRDCSVWLQPAHMTDCHVCWSTGNMNLTEYLGQGCRVSGRCHLAYHAPSWIALSRGSGRPHCGGMAVPFTIRGLVRRDCR